MKTGLLSTTTEFKEIETLEPGSWINLVNPSQKVNRWKSPLLLTSIL